MQIGNPRFNKSFKYFKSNNDGIRFGLLAVKNIGAALVEKIINDREQNGEYKNIFDFATMDILSSEIKSAWSHLGEISGITSDEAIIDKIFSKFCLGK